MKHVDEQGLAMMALGEGPDPAESIHLRECARCRRDLDHLRDVVAALRTPVIAEEDLLTPPDTVWEGIAAELRIPDRVVAFPTGGRSGATATSPPRAGRRTRRFAVALAACAALLGAASGSAITWWLTKPQAPAVQTVADGQRLESLRASSAGYARLQDQGGRRTLDITVKGLPETAGYFEVWLMDSTHTKLVSMGALGPDGHATLPVPETIDLNEYSVVDVSLQPYNGKVEHSGESLVRGAYAG
ncbi:anti-sigma factor [Streptomyces sp. NPDC058877]|uniref:anti-sigma factor n=1 Tax=Streptomyces sp. NPDC058877 TaxID=3346665 RepID=UPI0036788DC8